MFANWVEQTTATGGTGTLTLSAVTDAPDVQDVWGSSGNQKISYAVGEYATSARTGPPVKAEAGIGTVALSTMVLTRTKVLTTWDGTTYAAVSPSALSFGTDSTKIRVRVAALDELGPRTIPFYSVVSPSEDIGLCSRHAAGRGSISNRLISGFEQYAPMFWQGAGPVVQAGMVCSTAATGGFVKMALYEVKENGYPGRKIADLGEINCGTTGIKTVSVTPFHLPRGMYFTATMRSVSDTGFWGMAVSVLSHMCGYDAGDPIDAFRQTVFTGGSYAAGFPADASTSGWTTNLAQGSQTMFLKPAN